MLYRFRFAKVGLGGRGIDRNGDGRIEDREGCIVFDPAPAGIRDCLRQTVVDLMQLVRLIRSGLDMDGTGGSPLDAGRIYCRAVARRRHRLASARNRAGDPGRRAQRRGRLGRRHFSS